jgi:CHAT domain-containing protein
VQAGQAEAAGEGVTAGVLDGEAILDMDFTRRALSRSLASEAPVVHIASHFRLDPKSRGDTVLLLGDGNTLSLSEIGVAPDLDFKGLDLLTLSACDTASGASGGEGKEVESFGETVQLAGASAVLASLWPVDDSSTSMLMQEFYRLRYVEGKDKAQALRGAQLSVMKGKEGASGENAGNRGTAVSGRAGDGEGKPSPGAFPGRSHPFYWAPFVIMGNWR